MWPFSKKIDNKMIREMVETSPTYQQLLKNHEYQKKQLASLKARLITRKSPKEAVRFIKEWEDKLNEPTLEQLINELFPMG